MANRIQLRRGGAQEWANANPTLAQGELGVELDTGRIKIGDGVTAWNSLRYERPIESTSNTANTLVQRDADGNFAAGTITATLIGNASTAARLSSTRQIQLSTDITASGVFDGSQNLNLNAELSLVQTLPHYDGTSTPTGTYTKVVVDAKGRIINASNPTTLADYGLNGSVEGQSAQPYDADLNSLASLSSTGLVTRTSSGVIQTRQIVGSATRIAIQDGYGIAGNPTVDLIATAVVDGNYNTESLTSVSANGPSGEPFGTETVNATKFTVDQYGRLTSATNVPIATATEGSKYASYNAGTTYSRYDIIEEGGNVYQALATIAAGGGAPSHTSGDTGQWRYLAAAAVEQKGLASFAQEDFDVDSNGHVTIAAAGVDNTQLQNNRIIFTDGNTIDEFELDNELTTSTAHTGFDYLNYIKINDTSGNLLFGANNTGDSGAGEIDVNVRSYFSDPDITLDGATAQTLDKSGNGNFIISLTQNASTSRNLEISTTNAGSGTSNVIIRAEDSVRINATDANGNVEVEDARFQNNYIGTSNATMHLDPGDDRATTGLVRIHGDLQIDGTTTTVNSTTMTVDDVVLTLGGDTAPASDDNLDRGVEFRYYDTQARLGFYGWDTNYTDLGGHEGGYRFLHAATNTSEVFTGTDSGIIAGNVKLTTNTNSTSNTTGDLVVAGGAGITQDVNIGGLLDVDGTFRANSTSRFDDNIVLQGASKTLQLNNGSGTTRIELQTTTGNASFYGVVDITNNLNVNTDKFNVTASNGNTQIAGAVDANSTLNVAGFTHLEDTDEPTLAATGTDNAWEVQSNDYGAFRFDGGGYVEGDTLYNSDIYINGLIIQKETTTEVFNEQNNLRIRKKLFAGSQQELIPSYASHANSNLKVFGGAGIRRSLHIGARQSGEGLFIGKLNSGSNIEFQVIGDTGNTTIGRSGNGSATEGLLTVYGDTLLDRNVVITGTTEINNTLDVDANFAVRTSGGVDKFTVASASGNTVIAGTLNVNDAVDLDTTLNVDGTADFQSLVTLNNGLTLTNGTTNFQDIVRILDSADSTGVTNTSAALYVAGGLSLGKRANIGGQLRVEDSIIIDASNEIFSIRNGSAVEKFGVDTDNGNTNIIGTLTVGDATQINDTLGVSGVTTITRNTQQTLTGSYAADGAFRLTGGAGIQKNLAVGGDARVYGATELTGALDLNNSADISGALVTHDNVTITADNKFFKIQTAGGVDKFTVDTDNGNTVSQGTLTVAGDAALQSDLTVTGNLTVNGSTTTVNSTVTTLDDPIITLGGDTAPQSNDAKDRGVEFRYYDGSAQIGFFGYDRSASQYVFLTDATNNSEVLAGTDGDLRAGSLNLTGSGTALDVDADANIDGTLTVDGQIRSQVTSGPALVIPTTNKINNLNADLLDSMTTASAATPTTVVSRDSNGDFSANQITAASGVGAAAGFLGNATTADALRTARVITIDGVVNGNVSFDGSQAVTITTTYDDGDITALAAQTTETGYLVRTAANTYAHRTLQVTASSGITLTNADGVSGNTTINVASASTNSANNLVLRDANGDFSAGIITATRFEGDGAFDLVAPTTLTKNIAPDTDDTYDIGNGSRRYSNIYSVLGDFSGMITASGGITGNLTGDLVAPETDTKQVRPDTTDTYNLGLSTRRWLNVYSGLGNFSGMITASGGVTGDLTGNLVAPETNTKQVRPDTDNSHALGLSSRRWAGIWGVLGNFSGAITASGGVVGDLTGDLVAPETDAKAIRPDTTDTYNLGLSTRRWAGIWGVLGNFSGMLTASGGVTGDLTGNLVASDTQTKQVRPDTDNTYNLGLGSFRYANIYSNYGNFADMVTASGGVTGDLTGNLVAADTQTKQVRPDADGTYSLGLGSFRYANIYSDYGNFAQMITATGGVTGDLTGNLVAPDTQTKQVRPDADGAYSLGLGSFRYQNVYSNYGNFDNTLTASGGITGDLTGDVTGTVSSISNHDTDSLSEGSTNLYYTDARADARVAAATGANLDLTNQDTDDLTEGTSNLYYTEARVQTKLDNAFAQLQAMLNNLATTTTLTLNLSGDPVPGDVESLDAASLVAGTGYVTATDVATTTTGSGTGLTVDITAVAGAITAVTINNDGSGYAVGDTVTITGGNADATIDVLTVLQMQVGDSVVGDTSATSGTITAIGATSVTVDNVSGFFKPTETVSAGNVTTLSINSFA